MPMTDEFILGDVLMHGKFQVAVEILERFVSVAPRSISMAQLADATGGSPRAIAQLCKSLHSAGLIQHAEHRTKEWALARDAGTITLEDVFRCVTAAPTRQQRAAGEDYSFTKNVDLLIMQATIAINQSIFKHLRQFPLNRLKKTGFGKPPPLMKTFQMGCLNGEALTNGPAL